ncbi:MAG: galactosyldiacylglycerol synthase [Burkholderiales bacterium]
MKKRIDLVYFNAGGGHRAAALALQDVIQSQRRPWEVRLINLFEVLDSKGRFQRVTGLAPEDLYNKRLAHGWTLGLAQELKLLQALIRLSHGTLLEILTQHWLKTEPDLVVSLVPNFNRVLHQSVAATLPGVPFVTVMTDLADLPPHFWIEPGQPQHLVCGTPRALEQARAAGYRDTQLSLTSGMILRPSFYEPAPTDRPAERRALGLDAERLDGRAAERPVGLVMFGGQGSMEMLRIARQLRDQPLILLCGHNTALAARLRAQSAGVPHAVVGYTTEVPRYMRLADYFIGKPGPGCLSEALHCGLPVLTFENTWTMPQERYNTHWVRALGVGRVVRSVRAIRPGVADLLADLPVLQAAVQRWHNRAVFELPEIFADLLHAAALPGLLPAQATLAVDRETPHALA